MPKDTIHYDDLSEDQKRKLKELALTMGYRIEGTTDEEMKEICLSVLKRDDEFRKKFR